ncbi:MAG: hypothetical protein M0P64_04305 [Candidatus Pacebacteria bacterium]|jgi:hypothetical protein|nr:hypothetical protein [Candidatus Paceibacterota bacterium]
MSKKLISLFLVGVATVSTLVFSYDNFVIHPKLSGAAIDTYNASHETKLTDEKALWITMGAIAEDADPRYLNHFYDPTTGNGLEGPVLSGLPVVAWTQEQKSISGDYSESAILQNYREGDLKRAYEGVDLRRPALRKELSTGFL